jgi:hypothetical protein
MAGVFQNIDPHPPTARRVCTPRLWCGGRTHSLVGVGGGGQFEDVRHSSVFYVCKYFVLYSLAACCCSGTGSLVGTGGAVGGGGGGRVVRGGARLVAGGGVAGARWVAASGELLALSSIVT